MENGPNACTEEPQHQCQADVDQYEYDEFSVSDASFSLDYDESLHQACIASDMLYKENQQHVRVPQTQTQMQQCSDQCISVYEDPFILDLEPLPLLDLDERRPSVDDRILSWLICESNLLLSGLDTL